MLPEPVVAAEFALHQPDEMLRNCQRYISSRQPDGEPYTSPQREIEALRAVLVGSNAILRDAHKAIPCLGTRSGRGLIEDLHAAVARYYVVCPHGPR